MWQEISNENVMTESLRYDYLVFVVRLLSICNLITQTLLYETNQFNFS